MHNDQEFLRVVEEIMEDAFVSRIFIRDVMSETLKRVYRRYEEIIPIISDVLISMLDNSDAGDDLIGDIAFYSEVTEEGVWLNAIETISTGIADCVLY